MFKGKLDKCIKKSIVILLILAFVVPLTACKDTQTSSEITPTESPAIEGKIDKDEFVLPVEGTRPYAAMIDNEGTRSLPQGGLNMAQVIYEIIVEGGETRIMPVFWGVDPTMIGPIRSSRHYFLDYAMEHDAIYSHIGWSPMAQSDISKFKINNINGLYVDGVFWDITKDRNNWQDSYTSMEKLKAYTKRANYRTTTDKKLAFTYNATDNEIENGQIANEISMSYSWSYTCGFTYDAEKSVYMRLRKGKPQMERVSDKQLSAKNIIIQTVSNRTIKGDDKGRQEILNLGSGQGWYITCGKAIKIKWSKPQRNSVTRYTDEAGNPIMLNPGQTWIQIVPTGGEIAIK